MSNKPSQRGGSRGGRGGRIVNRDSESEDEPVSQSLRGRGGRMVRGRPEPESEEEDDDEDEEDDDEYDMGEDDEDDDEEDEEDDVEDVEEATLTPFLNTLNAFVVNPTSVPLSDLLASFSFFATHIRAPTCMGKFVDNDGSKTLIALINEAVSEEQVCKWETSTLVALLKVFVEFSQSRKSVDTITEMELLPKLVTLAKRNPCDEVVNLVLESIDYGVQHSNSRRESAQQYAGALKDANGNSLDVLELLGTDPRDALVSCGFVELLSSKISSFESDSLNLALNILYELVDQMDGKVNYDPKTRFLNVGGIAELDKLLKKQVDLLLSDDESFVNVTTLLMIRFTSALCLNDEVMNKSIGSSTGIAAYINSIMKKYRESNFDCDEPLDEATEQLLICATEFISIFCDSLENQKKILETEIVESVLNFLEHAALGETNLAVSSEFRTMLLNVLVAAMDVENNLPVKQHFFTDLLRSHGSAATILVELMEQNYEDPDEDDEEAFEEKQERQEHETPVICDILLQLANTEAGAQSMVTLGVDRKMQGFFEDAKRASAASDDPEEQSVLYDRMEKSLSVLVPLAKLTSVQKMLFDKKMEPLFRKLLLDNEGSEYVRAEVLGLLTNLVAYDKWAGIVQTRPKDYIDCPIKLVTHWLINVRAAALNFLGTAGKQPVLASILANKPDFLKAACTISNGEDKHDEEPEEEDEEEEDEEGHHDDEDPAYMAVTALSAMLNMAHFPRIAEIYVSMPDCHKTLQNAFSEKQEDSVLRALAAMFIGTVSLHDKEKKLVPAPWLELIAKYTPNALLPEVDEAKNPSVYIKITKEVEWDVHQDIVPLVNSSYIEVKKLAAYLLASVAASEHILAESHLTKAEIAPLASDSQLDDITSQFVKLALDKLN